MTPLKIAAVGALFLLSRLAFADGSFQSTTQITGGSLVDTMKNLTFMKSVKDLLAPTSTLTMVHGNQKAVISKDSTEIIDLDKETITRTDNLKKTYSVITFAQMREMMRNMPKAMQDAQAKLKQAQAQQPATDLKTTFDVSVKNTGVSKEVNGLTAQEQLITMTTKVTDPNAPAGGPSSITYIVTTDVWIAPDPPQVKEIEEFDMRMGKKIAEGLDVKALAEQFQSNTNAGSGMMFASQPGAGAAMMEMSKEMSKIKGTRVLEVTSMTADIPGMPPATAGGSPAAAAPPPPSGQSVAGQVAGDTATQTAQGESGHMGVLGNALSNSVLGAFHRKKATPPPAATPAPTPATTPGTPAASGVLMSTTTQKSSFSSEPVPFSYFVIPAGFKQVESPMAKLAQ